MYTFLWTCHVFFFVCFIMTLNNVIFSRAVGPSVDKSDTEYCSQIVDRNFPLLGFVEMFDLRLPSYVYGNR